MLWRAQVPAVSYLRPGRQQAGAVLAAYKSEAKAAEVDKARAKTADARAARLVQHRQQQNGGAAVSSTLHLHLDTCCLLRAVRKQPVHAAGGRARGCDISANDVLLLQLRCQLCSACGIRSITCCPCAYQQVQGGAAMWPPLLPPQPTAGKKRGRPPKQPTPGLAPPAVVGAAGAGMLGKEAENRRVRVWWPDDKVRKHLPLLRLANTSAHSSVVSWNYVAFRL